MRKILAAMSCSLLVSVSGVAQASPQEDAAYIADTLITDEFQTMMFDTGVKAFAGQMAGLLSERSVKIKDNAAYLALMTKPYEAASNTDLRAIARDMLSKQPDDVLANIAKHMRDEAIGVDNAAIAPPIALDDLPGAIEAAFDEDKIVAEAGIVGIVMGVIPAVLAEARSIDVALTDPFMAEILETDGVFQFPNRIARKDLINEIRAANP